MIPGELELTALGRGVCMREFDLLRYEEREEFYVWEGLDSGGSEGGFGGWPFGSEEN